MFSHMFLLFYLLLSYFSIFRKSYSLISWCVSWLHGNPISCHISCTFCTPIRYVVLAPPYFWLRMRGFLEERCSWKPGSRLTTSDFSIFCLLPKVSQSNARWANANHTFLTHKNPQTDTFLRDISPTKLRSTARVRNPQGSSKLMNKVDCRVPCALLKAIVQAFLSTNSFAAGSSTYPCHMACISNSVP
jgi:hypothetical protein